MPDHDTLGITISATKQIKFDPMAIGKVLEATDDFLPVCDNLFEYLKCTSVATEHANLPSIHVEYKGFGSYFLEIDVSTDQISVSGVISRKVIMLTPDVFVDGDTNYISYSRVFILCFFARAVAHTLGLGNGFRGRVLVQTDAGLRTKILEDDSEPSPEALERSRSVDKRIETFEWKTSSDLGFDIQQLFDSLLGSMFGLSLNYEKLRYGFTFDLWIESIRAKLWSANDFGSSEWRNREASYKQTIRLREEKLMRDYSDYVRKLYNSPDGR